MTLDYLRDAVDAANDFYFMFNNARVGVECLTVNSENIFTLWHGDFEKEYKTFEEVIDDKIFDGKSIRELLEEDMIEIDFA